MPNWWPCWLPWIGVETWGAEAIWPVPGAARPLRILRAEWLRRGVTIAAWDSPHA